MSRIPYTSGKVVGVYAMGYAMNDRCRLCCVVLCCVSSHDELPTDCTRGISSPCNSNPLSGYLSPL